VGVRGLHQQLEWGCSLRVLLCPGDSNLGDWDPEAAAGQTKRLNPEAGGIHAVLVYIHISTNAPPSCTAREQSRMRSL